MQKVKDINGKTIRVGHIILTKPFGLKVKETLHKVVEITLDTNFPISAIELRGNYGVLRRPSECKVVSKKQHPEHYI